MRTGKSLCSCAEEVRSFVLWRDCLCEFFLNVIVLFLGTATGLKLSGDNGQSPGLIPAGLQSGLLVGSIIEAFTHVEGAHINPAITVLFTIVQQVSVLKGVLYIAFQAAGSYVGVLLFSLCVPDTARGLISPFQLKHGVQPYQGVIMECVLTTLLCVITLGLIDKKRRTVRLPGLFIGFTVTCGIYSGAQYTGGCMHPGLAFGPAAYAGVWTNHWVYWLGPLLGAPVAWTLYTLFTWRGGRPCTGPEDLPEHRREEKTELMDITAAPDKPL